MDDINENKEENKIHNDATMPKEKKDKTDSDVKIYGLD